MGYEKFAKIYHDPYNQRLGATFGYSGFGQFEVVRSLVMASHRHLMRSVAESKQGKDCKNKCQRGVKEIKVGVGYS